MVLGDLSVMALADVSPPPRRWSGELPSILQCAICMEAYDSGVHQPKLLPCHHSFCRQCLVHIASAHGQILCPTCRERSSIMSPTPYGISLLQTNFYVTQMKDFLEEDIKVVTGCKKHGQEALVHFCETCEVLVCASCKLTDHKEAAGHAVKDLETAKNRQIAELTMLVAAAQQSILGHSVKAKTLETEMSNLVSAKSRSLSQMDKAFDKYIDLLNERRRTLREHILQEFTTRRDAIEEDVETVKVLEASLTGLVTQVKQTISSGSISELLAYKSKMSAKTQELAVIESSMKEIGNNFIKFEAEDTEVTLLDAVQNLGNMVIDTPLPCRVKIRKSQSMASLFSTMTVVVSDASGRPVENYPITVNLEDTQGDLIPTLVQHKSEGQYEVTFRPEISGLHRVEVRFLEHVFSGGSFALDVRSNDPVEVLGSEASEGGEMEFPRAVAVDRHNTLFVVDTGNNRIQKYSKTGEYLSELVISSETEVYSSCGLAIDDARGTLICPEVYVQEADLSEASAILVFSFEGELVDRFVFRDIMRRALSVAIDSGSHMIICDYELNTIFVFDKSGRLLRKFGQEGSGPGQFRNPTFVCVGENDNIIVADGNNHRIQVFDKTGKFLSQFGSYGSGKGQLNMPFGVSADFHGNILVVDGGNKRVQVFKQNGEFLAAIESLGDKLNAPRGIAVTSDGYVFVADRDNNCVKKFKYMHCTSL